MLRGLGAALIGLMLMAIALVSPQRALADERDFTLVNNSRTTIMEVYVSSVRNPLGTPSFPP